MYYNSTQLKKGGSLVIKEWDEENKIYMDMEIQPEDYSYYLHDQIVLDKNVNLRDVFVFISKNRVLFENITGCSFLNDLIAEALLPPEKDPNKNDIVLLKLSKRGFIDNYRNNDYLEIIYDFCGVGKNDEYAIEFSKINSLTLYNLSIDDKLMINDAFESDKVYLTAKVKFTLDDLIRGIIGEFSNFGPPKLREVLVDELKDRKDKILTEGSPKHSTMEEVLEKMGKLVENHITKCKMCGNNSKGEIFGKPEDICESCYDKIGNN